VAPGGQAPIVAQTNLTFTVMAANLTDSPQRYEGPGVRILQGLRPDIAALQEFRYSNSTPADLRTFVDLAFGPGFQFYRESGYAIPNGIVSRWPIRQGGSWDDPQVPDRGFAWAQIDLPGPRDLYVVSVHLHSSGGASSRAIEAGVIQSNIQASFPADAWVVVAGDLNTDSRGETAVTVFKGFLSDSPVPTDAAAGGVDKTNKRRTKPYDYVLPSFSLTNRLAPVRAGGQQFPNGLVFDSAVFTPLSAVPPIQYEDSTNCQHMAVLKAFEIQYAVTNWIEAAAPSLTIVSNRVLVWNSPAGLLFRVQGRSGFDRLSGWEDMATVGSVTASYRFAVTNMARPQQHFRVVCP